MKSIGEALREIVPRFEPVGVARCGLLDALGLVIAEDVMAERDLPRFDHSAMDGYAVRHHELAADTRLALRGESRAGGPAPAPLAHEAAMRIFTGAPLPAGADTVVMQENTHADADGTGVHIARVPARGANVRLRGSDLAQGSIALARGKQVGPGEIGLLAALGRHSVSVHQRPRVAIVSTGDELREIGHDDAPGAIADSNAYALAAQVRAAGGEPWLLPVTADRVDDIAATLAQALRADIVLSIGGVSVGAYDLVGQALERAGVQVKFWKVAIKPGKPLMFGMAGRVPVLGLPGNPVSAMVTFEVFGKPGLRRMLGHAAPYPTLIDVELAHDHRHSIGRIELARARVARAPDGHLHAHLNRQQGSGSLPSMCGVDALVVLSAEVERFARGARLQALPLHGQYTQSESPFA